MAGCAIQHRTLREIRQGIKAPKPSPKIYLPDRFKHTTTELPDGTIVIIEDEYHAEQRAAQRKFEGRDTPPPPLVVVEDTPEDRALAEAETREGFIGPRRAPPEEKPLTIREKNEREQLAQNLPNPDPRAVDKRPISRAERRRLIREELRRISHVEGPAYQRRLW